MLLLSFVTRRIKHAGIPNLAFNDQILQHDLYAVLDSVLLSF